MNIKAKVLQKLNLQRKDEDFSLGYNHVDLYFWRTKNGALNFGDHLSKVIVTKVLADKGHLLEEETTYNKRLLAIGSVLHFANTNDTVWGSGVNGKIDVAEHKFSDLDVRAVRGPLTREFLSNRGIEVPEIYGDPALLLPTIFEGRFKKVEKLEYATVPNLHDLILAKQKKWTNIISPLSSWNHCIEEILSSKFVIASSLHGLIIAEAYGIPARYIRLSETENLFKYNDYTLGTGRGNIEYASSIEEALEMGGMEPPKFDPNQLLNSFPIDLWK